MSVASAARAQATETAIDGAQPSGAVAALADNDPERPSLSSSSVENEVHVVSGLGLFGSAGAGAGSGGGGGAGSGGGGGADSNNGGGHEDSPEDRTAVLNDVDVQSQTADIVGRLHALRRVYPNRVDRRRGTVELLKLYLPRLTAAVKRNRKWTRREARQRATWSDCVGMTVFATSNKLPGNKEQLARIVDVNERDILQVRAQHGICRPENQI